MTKPVFGSWLADSRKQALAESSGERTASRQNSNDVSSTIPLEDGTAEGDVVAIDNLQECAGMTTSGGGWHSPLSKRMFAQGGDTVAAKIWHTWARRAEELAAEHVATAFRSVTRQFQKAAARAETLQGDITGVLAMSGRDVSDHEATMRQAQDLLRMSMPQASTALLWPEDFRNLVTVTRRARDQLMRTPGRHADPMRNVLDGAGSDGEEGDDVEIEEEELVDATRSFVHCRQESGSKAPVVLLLGQIEQVPKAVLRDFLSSLNGTCADEGIPLMILFGLSLPPQGRMELLEDEPLAGLTLVDAVNLFDIEKICQLWFADLMEDRSTLLMLRPELISNLAKKLSARSCRSLSQLLASLALLLMELRTRSYGGFLCAPIAQHVQHMLQQCDNESECKQALQAEFAQAITLAMKQSEGHTDHPDCLSEEAQEWFDGTGILNDDEGCLEALGEVAAEILMWRTHLAASLPAWDALYRAAHPTTKAADPVWRLSKLVNALWPEKATPVKGGEAIQAESRNVAALLHECLSSLASATEAVLQELTQELQNYSPALPRSVQAALPVLQAHAQPSAIHQAVQRWFAHLQQKCWQPLEGDARCLFVYGFCTTESRVRAAWEAVETKLGCSDTHYVDTVLRPLALGSSKTKLDDMALVYRLLECAEGRSVAVVSMWKGFVEVVSRMASDSLPIDGDNTNTAVVDADAVVVQESTSNETALRTRFGHALLALKVLGVASPYRANKLGEAGFTDWRLRKRCFGRVCMQSRQTSGGISWDDTKKQQPVMDEDDLPLLQLASERAAAHTEEVKTPSPKKSACMERTVPLNVDDEMNFGLKRKRELDAVATSEKMRKVVQRGPKIYMG